MLYWLTTFGLSEHRNLARHESVTKHLCFESLGRCTLYNYTWNDDLATIFEAKLKTAIDNQGPVVSKAFSLNGGWVKKYKISLHAL